MAYSDLQEFLKRLEVSGKLHWIEQPVDPSWEVAAVTRHVFDRYGWNDRPALGFRRVGESEMPLVVGVVGGSPAIYALALSTTVDNIPAIWERGQRNPIEPVLLQSGLCKEVVSRGADADVRILPQVVWTPSRIPDPINSASGCDEGHRMAGAMLALPVTDQGPPASWDLRRRGAARGEAYSPIRCEKTGYAGGGRHRSRPNNCPGVHQQISLRHR